MNYAQELKTKENKATNLQAKALAKKQSIEETLLKRSKLEDECKLKFNISLNDVPERLSVLEKKLEQKLKDVTEAVEKLESDFAKIKC